MSFRPSVLPSIIPSISYHSFTLCDKIFLTISVVYWWTRHFYRTISSVPEPCWRPARNSRFVISWPKKCHSHKISYIMFITDSWCDHNTSFICYITKMTRIPYSFGLKKSWLIDLIIFCDLSKLTFFPSGPPDEQIVSEDALTLEEGTDIELIESR